MSPKVRLRQRMAIILQMVTCFVIFILLAQLWLFTVTLDAMLNDQTSNRVAVAALICSGIGAGAVWSLIRFFLRTEDADAG